MYAEEAQDDYQDAALKTIFQVHLKRPPGDILVFLPGGMRPSRTTDWKLTESTPAGQDDIESLSAAIHSYAKDLALSFSTFDSVSRLGGI